MDPHDLTLLRPLGRRILELEKEVEFLKARCDFSDEMLGIVMKDLHYLKYGEVLETEEVGEA